MEEEFREFVAARSAALLRTAYLLAGDWATAEDLLQTALTKTYLAWRRLGEIEAVEPYARRVLINTATSWWRRRWHGERPTEVMPERAAPDQIEEHLDRDALWRHVKALPARQRAVLVLRFYEDLSEAQTAELLNISVGTVKSQTSRALTALRQRLGAEGELHGSRAAKAGQRPAASAASARPVAPAASAASARLATTPAAPAASDPPVGSSAVAAAQPDEVVPVEPTPASGSSNGGTRVPAPRPAPARTGLTIPGMAAPAYPSAGVDA
jgi:RNA polymerase sigma-70 factor (sigma-E family)